MQAEVDDSINSESDVIICLLISTKTQLWKFLFSNSVNV